MGENLQQALAVTEQMAMIKELSAELNCSVKEQSCSLDMIDECCVEDNNQFLMQACELKSSRGFGFRSLGSGSVRKGKASAARVSRGAEVEGKWAGLTVKKPVRDSRQHPTVTVVLYNTVAGGVPSEEDVRAAVDDMEELYKACAWNGML